MSEAERAAKLADRPITARDLADVFGCMWNAAIGEARRQEAGFEFASILAEGFSSMSRRLAEIASQAILPAERGDASPEWGKAGLSVPVSQAAKDAALAFLPVIEAARAAGDTGISREEFTAKVMARRAAALPGSVLEAVARAFEECDIGFSLRLVRLVDDVSTYLLSTTDGEPDAEFGDQEDAYVELGRRKAKARSDAALRAIDDAGFSIVPKGAVVTNEMTDALRAMLDHYGPPSSVSDMCEYPAWHPISKARAALGVKETTR